MIFLFHVHSYGYNLEETKILHFIVYVCIACLGLFQTFVYFMINMFLINIIIYCTSLFRYFQHEIKHFEITISKIQKREDKVIELKRIITVHKRLMKFSKKFNEFCSHFLFVYYLAFTFLACLLCNDIRMVI